MLVERGEHRYQIVRLDDTNTLLQNKYGAEFEEPIQTLMDCGYQLVLENDEQCPIEWTGKVARSSAERTTTEPAEEPEVNLENPVEPSSKEPAPISEEFPSESEKPALPEPSQSEPVIPEPAKPEESAAPMFEDLFDF